MNVAYELSLIEKANARFEEPSSSSSARKPAPITPAQLSPAEAIERVSAALSPAMDREVLAYPVDALCGLSAAATAIGQGVQCDPATAGQSVLGAAALLTQGLHNVLALNGRAMPISLALLSVVLSGDGKDSADAPALARVHYYQAKEAAAYKRELDSFGRTKANVKRGEKPDEPSPPAYRIVKDATVEGLKREMENGVSSQGLFSAEAGAVLSGYGFSPEQLIKTAAALTGLFDAGHLSVSRAGSNAGGGRIERYGLRLSSHLMIQPAALGDAVTSEALQNQGFWPRWLLAWPEPLSPRIYRPWSPGNDPDVIRYWGRCDDLLDSHLPENCNDVEVLDFTAEAKRELVQFFEGMEHEARKGSLKRIRPFALRATELASRVAAVLTAWEGLSKIGVNETEGAISLTAYSLANWQSVVSDQKVDVQADRAIELYTWLAKRQPTSVALRDIPRLAPSSLRSASVRDDAIKLLEAHGFVAVTHGVVHVQGV